MSLYRRQSGALFSAGQDGADKLTTQANFPRDAWVRVHLEVEIGKAIGSATLSFDGGPARRLTDIPIMKPPIWVTIGGLSQGKTAEHDAIYDDVTLSY